MRTLARATREMFVIEFPTPNDPKYQTLLRDGGKPAEAEEGLGLLALAGHRTDEARRDRVAGRLSTAG